MRNSKNLIAEIIFFLNINNIGFELKNNRKNRDIDFKIYNFNKIFKINIEGSGEFKGQINISEGPDMVPTEDLLNEVNKFIKTY